LGVAPNPRGRGRDLVHGLALDAQAHEEGPDLGRGGLPFHDLIHHGGHQRAIQVPTFRQQG
jgi:hypothetical protein